MLKNFKTIANKCINGKIKGIFTLGTGAEIDSDLLEYNDNVNSCDKYPYVISGDVNIELTNNGKNHRYSHSVSMFDVVEFKKID